MSRMDGALLGLALAMSALALVGGGQRSQAHAEPQIGAVARTPQVTECREVVGPCGEGMFNMPTYFFDRVRFTCPEEAPILNGLRFDRCGQRDTPNEGLSITATCCTIR
jgi:hypothetical protein